MENCVEFHNNSVKRTCCYGDFCNNQIPNVWPWPSPSSSVAPTKTSSLPSLLTQATTPVSPTDPNTIISPDFTEQPSTIDPRQQLFICHCSLCKNGDNTCEAKYACASLIVKSALMTLCINDKFTCENKTYDLNCCYKDYCNVNPTAGLPCDDEDAEQSGCDYG